MSDNRETIGGADGDIYEDVEDALDFEDGVGGVEPDPAEEDFRTPAPAESLEAVVAEPEQAPVGGTTSGSGTVGGGLAQPGQLGPTVTFSDTELENDEVSVGGIDKDESGNVYYKPVSTNIKDSALYFTGPKYAEATEMASVAGLDTTSSKDLTVLSGLGHLKLSPTASGLEQDKDKEAKHDKNVTAESKVMDDSASVVPNTPTQGSIATESNTHGQGTGASGVGATAKTPKSVKKPPLFKSTKYTFGTRPKTTGTVDVKLKGKGVPSTPSVASASGSTLSLASSKKLTGKYTIPEPFRLTEMQPKKPVEVNEAKFVFKARPAPKAFKIIPGQGHGQGAVQLGANLDLPPRPHTALPISSSESRIREQAKMRSNEFDIRRKAEKEKQAIEKEKRQAELAKKMAESDLRRKAELEKKKADVEARKLETERKMLEAEARRKADHDKMKLKIIEAEERRKLAAEKKTGKKIEESKPFDFKARPAPRVRGLAMKESKSEDMTVVDSGEKEKD